MKSFQTIQYEKHHQIISITLARPDLRNAFNDEMIAELRHALQEVHHDPKARILILRGQGSAFCAGADLRWMKKMISYDFEDNLEDSLALAHMLWAIEELSIPSIALVHGPAVGGGVGVVAACDIALASHEAWFALSEVKLGLAPAVISPFILKKIGDRACRELFLTGKRISAVEAKKIGLVHEICPPEQLEALLKDYCTQLTTSGPSAIAACKDLLRNLVQLEKKKLKEYTARTIAHLRISEEGQEGMKAFLQKRKPNWEITLPEEDHQG